jgi:hypothetical protein
LNNFTHYLRPGGMRQLGQLVQGDLNVPAIPVVFSGDGYQNRPLRCPGDDSSLTNSMPP